MNRIFTTAILSLMAITTPAQQHLINDVLTNMGKEAIVIIRQDYQLVDEEDNIRNAADKDYWKRTYALGLRVGDDKFMISDETVKPWSKEALSKNDKFQPVVSSTAYRPLEAIEFDEITYESDNLTEIQENRIYTFDGSEIPGVSVIAPMGTRQTHLIIVESATPISESDESVKFNINVIPSTFNFNANKCIYDLKVQLPTTTFGGFAVIPVTLRPGLVDFCVVGMLQKVGGIWKLISVSESSLIYQSNTPTEYNLETMVGNLIDNMESEMRSFVDTLGFGGE